MQQDFNKTLIESYTSANKSLRGMIQVKAKEINRLEHFEERFRNMKDNYAKYKTLSKKHEQQTEKLQIRLNQELHRQRQAENDLRIEIVQIGKAIEEQTLENEKLEKDLKDNVEKLHLLKYNDEQSNGSYAASLGSNSIISRLCEDLR